jgi:predicted RNase H-like HicB family nuclease
MTKHQQPQSLEDYLSLKYPISLYPEEEGGYTATIPDLPGCMTQGETLEETIQNINEARELWLETVYKSGKKAIPLPRTVTHHVFTTE